MMVATIFKSGSSFFAPLDRHFAMGLGRIAGETSERVLFAAALAQRQVREGHTCLDLSTLDREILAAEFAAQSALPGDEDWLAALRASPLVAQVEATGELTETAEDPAPLVIDRSGRIYLRRYWFNQEGLAQSLFERASAVVDALDLDLLASGLERLFGQALSAGAPLAADGQGELFAQPSSHTEQSPEPDRQRLAAAMAVLRQFCVITGGPGTGKTSTVVKILALLIEQSRARNGEPPRIVLVAPTGKAAAALSDSIRRAVEELDCDDDVKRCIPRSAATIHRCLGVLRRGPRRFRHGSDQPLAADLVLVDEASMVDLALMTDLVAAIPRSARLILLGDEHQLASVEAGAVLGDICNPEAGSAVSSDLAASLGRVMGADFQLEAGGLADESAPLANSIARLTRSYRYAEASGIGALARAINCGDARSALAILDDPAVPDVALREPVSSRRLSEAFQADVVGGFAGYLAEENPREQLERLSEFRVLCTHRRGYSGVVEINRVCEAMLRRARQIRDSSDLYQGRPIMVTRNDYGLELFNGDIGVVQAREDNVVRALFLDANGVEVRFAESRLPDYETAFAMTVHKSQGSEFDRVALVVSDVGAYQITRELIYTAVTRARKSVTFFATRDAIDRAIGQRIDRASGLRDALWRPPGSDAR